MNLMDFTDFMNYDKSVKNGFALLPPFSRGVSDRSDFRIKLNYVSRFKFKTFSRY